MLTHHNIASTVISFEMDNVLFAHLAVMNNEAIRIILIFPFSASLVG